MKHTLPIVTSVAILLAASGLAGQTPQRGAAAPGGSLPAGGYQSVQEAAQEAAGIGVPLVARAPEQAQAEATADGQELVAAAAQAVYGQSSISARLRYRIDIFGQQLLGSGNYLQLGYADHKKTRMELKIQIGDRVSSVQQVCDGRFLWIHRNLPDGSRLSRCDLREIRAALEQSSTTPATRIDSNWMALGGLSKLLDGLEANFEFGQAQAGQLQEVPVWITEGTWRPERLAGLVPGQREAISAGQSVPASQLPPQLPEQVRMVLGRDDRFPYRIEYLRRDENQDWQAILTMEFFEVQLGGIPPRSELFVYDPGEQEYFDNTQEVLHKLGLEPAAE